MKTVQESLPPPGFSGSADCNSALLMSIANAIAESKSISLNSLDFDQRESLFQTTRAIYLGLLCLRSLPDLSCASMSAMLFDLVESLALPSELERELLLASRKIEFEQNVTLVQADALALCQELAAVASRLLDFALVSWGEKVEIRSFDRMKKHSGSYFTPVALADMVVGRVLGELVAEGRSGPFKIIDPAMGPGIFLLVAIERLKQLACNQGESVFPEDLVDIASGLYGVDLDLANVIVARFCLWFATGTKIEKPFSLMSNLRVGNALLGCSKEEARHIPEAFFKRNDLKLVKRIPSPKKLELKKAIESGYFSNPDRWCALWFAERADLLIDFTCPDWLEKLGQELDKLASREMFFHFQSQYAEVFGEGDNTSGFDAVIGNPPWEIAKPNSREIFARYDPDYWSYGKQKAITIQQELLDRHPDLALHWSNLQKNYQFLIHFLKHAPSQFVRGKKSFCHQGRGDANLYKLFIEQAYALTRSAGVFSLIVPAGIYCDSGCRDLRGLLLKNCRWSSLTGFENVDSAFDIHRSFKYCFFVASKNGTTDSISASFLNTLASADSASLSQNPQYTKEKIDSFSPEHSILLESEGSAALNLLEKIYSGSTPVSRFAAGAYSLSYTREFDMTMSSHLFETRDVLASRGYKPDMYGNWLAGAWREYRDCSDSGLPEGGVVSADDDSIVSLESVSDVFVPLYEGRMIGQYDFAAKSWSKGRGRQARWDDIAIGERVIGSQYLVSKEQLLKGKAIRGLKTGFLAVGSDTNARSMISACLFDVACGNSVPVFHLVEDPDSSVSSSLDLNKLQLILTGIFNSFVFDFVVRRRLAGCNLNYFVLAECPLPELSQRDPRLLDLIARAVGRLSFCGYRYAGLIDEMGFANLGFALDPLHRTYLKAFVDVAVAQLFGLDSSDMSLILSGCLAGNKRDFRSFTLQTGEQLKLSDQSVHRLWCLEKLPDDTDNLSALAEIISDLLSQTSKKKLGSQGRNPKGFWRVDKTAEPQERHTVLTLLFMEVFRVIGDEPFFRFGDLLVEMSTSSNIENRSHEFEKHRLILERILS